MASRFLTSVLIQELVNYIMSLAPEIWKDIPGFEGLYQASTYGRIKSLPKSWYTSDPRRTRTHQGLILSPGVSKKGYCTVVLHKDRKKHNHPVHRLVALTFIPTNDTSLLINHKDLNPSNNHISNLEWCTYAENTQHAERHGRMYRAMQGKFNEDHPNSRIVLQYTKSGDFVAEWPSLCEVRRTLGHHPACISKVALGKRGSAHGFVWKYK